MSGLTLADIADLRAYEHEREEFRREVIALKRVRRIALGPILSVVFENRTTMRFQIQEMARAERIISDEAIQHELDVYNRLIPDVGELSMTLFLELTNDEELREWLPKLVGIERSLGVHVGDGESAVRVPAEVEPEHASQLTREEVTAAVHYVRIALSPADQRRFAAEPAALYVDHPLYVHETVLAEDTKVSLVADWEA